MQFLIPVPIELYKGEYVKVFDLNFSKGVRAFLSDDEVVIGADHIPRSWCHYRLK